MRPRKIIRLHCTDPVARSVFTVVLRVHGYAITDTGDAAIALTVSRYGKTTPMVQVLKYLRAALKSQKYATQKRVVYVEVMA